MRRKTVAAAIIIVVCLADLVAALYFLPLAFPDFPDAFAFLRPQTITTCTGGDNQQIIIAARGNTLWGVLAAPLQDETGRQISPLTEIKFKGKGQAVINDATITFDPEHQMLLRTADGRTVLANLPQNALRREGKRYIPDFKAFAQATQIGASPDQE